MDDNRRSITDVDVPMGTLVMFWFKVGMSILPAYAVWSLVSWFVVGFGRYKGWW